MATASTRSTIRNTQSTRKAPPSPGRRRAPYRRGRQMSVAGLIASVIITLVAYYVKPGEGDGARVARSAGPLVADSWQLYFSPNGGCTDAIIAELGRAEKSIHVQAYSFTSTPIAKALVEAKRRGVAVEVVLDKSQRNERYTSADFIAHAKIPTFIDDKHAIAHNKVIIIDGEVTITGSFNFSNAAEKSNAENLLILRSSELAERYLQNWHSHQAHSRAYPGKPLPPE